MIQISEEEYARLKAIETGWKVSTSEFTRVELNLAAEEVLAMCRHRDWSLHWTCRGAYLHLEASELIESLRGKRGTPLSEAADVLLVLMSITENAGIPFAEVFEQARKTSASLRAKPPYQNEERATPAEALR